MLLPRQTGLAGHLQGRRAADTGSRGGWTPETPEPLEGLLRARRQGHSPIVSTFSACQLPSPASPSPSSPSLPAHAALSPSPSNPRLLPGHEPSPTDRARNATLHASGALSSPRPRFASSRPRYVIRTMPPRYAVGEETARLAGPHRSGWLDGAGRGDCEAGLASRAHGGA